MKFALAIVALVIVGALFWPGPPAWCRWLSPDVLDTMIQLRQLEGVEVVEATDFGEFWEARVSATLASGSRTVAFLGISADSFKEPQHLVVHWVGNTHIECVSGHGSHTIGIDILSARNPKFADLGIRNLQTAVSVLGAIHERLQALPDTPTPSLGPCWQIAH